MPGKDDKENDKKAKKVKPDPEWSASMQRAHDIKVAKFKAGGEF